LHNFVAVKEQQGMSGKTDFHGCVLSECRMSAMGRQLPLALMAGMGRKLPLATHLGL
jgi:hypothetical protein